MKAGNVKYAKMTVSKAVIFFHRNILLKEFLFHSYGNGGAAI